MFQCNIPQECCSKVLAGSLVLKPARLLVVSQLRWLPFSIPKATEKEVDFVTVSQLTDLPRTQSRFPPLTWLALYLPGSAHHLWGRRRQVSERHRRPHLCLQRLHGRQVRLSGHNCVPCFSTETLSHIIFKLYIYLFFFLRQVLQQLRWRLSDW